MNTYLCVLVCVFGLTYAQHGPSVNTTQGVIVGMVQGNHSAFYGIPYGGSASGSNRFKAPTPAPSFPGVFHAVEQNVICAQPSSRGIIGTEDCLKLNVYTKNVTTPKPVLVWIQGEEFSSQIIQPYSFTKLLEEGLVVVTVNYRLSIFGFLCLGVPDAPGNAGLKDVVQALRWIQANIAGFGGNPNNVVLLGHGSGAAMVDLITLSPLATGLFHKAITLSGSGLAPWAVAYDPIGHANAIGDKLAYGGKGREELAKLLSTSEINLLGNALNDFEFPNNTVLFGPCIEDINVNPNDTFLSDSPINILRSGNYSHVPYLSGHTNREGTIRAGEAAYQQWLVKMQANFSDFIQVDLNLESNSNKTVVNSIRDFYFSQRQVNMETIEDFLDYIGDTTILVPVIRNARERALTSSSQVRLFEFTYRGTLNSDWPYQQIPLTGVKHGGILNYLFDFDLNQNDFTVRDRIIKRVVAFANTGNPNLQDSFITTWLPVDRTIYNALLISGEETVAGVSVFTESARTTLNQPEMDFWSNIFNQYYEPPKPVSSAGRLACFTIIVLLSQLFVTLF